MLYSIKYILLHFAMEYISNIISILLLNVYIYIYIYTYDIYDIGLILNILYTYVLYSIYIYIHTYIHFYICLFSECKLCL